MSLREFGSATARLEASGGRNPHHEARAAAVQRLLEPHAAAVRLRDRAHDRQAEARRAAADRPRRGRSARTPSRAARAGSRARRPRPRARPRRCCARPWPRPRCPGSVWRSAFSIRFRTRRCSSSRAPSTCGAGGRRDRDLVIAGDRLELGRRVGHDLATGRPAGAAPARPASARASSSRSATRRRMRREERSADAAASRCSPVSSSSSSSRLASTEVSGVRSSCEASATNSRWRASAPSVSARASSSAREHRVQRARQLGDLVLGLGVGDPHGRVARALDPARGRGQLGDRLHRAARGGQAGQQRQQRAAEHAEGEEDLHAVGGVLDVGDLARVLEEPRVGRACDRHAARLHAPAVDLGGARVAAAPKSGASAVWKPTRSSLRDHADRGVLGGGEVVEVERVAASAARSGCRLSS